MRAALALLLDGIAGSRQLFRHLAALEHDLARKDGQGRFLFEAPSDRLRIVLRQLDALIGPEARPGVALSELRNCLLDAIRTREQDERREAQRQPISSFFVDHKLQVSEVRPSEFDAAQAVWSSAASPPASRG